MEAPLIEIRENQKATWNKFSPGWKKWNEFTMHFLKYMGDSIIAALDIQSSDHVLDVACGTGEPGLTIAGMAKDGFVTGTDLSDGMLEVAKEFAASRKISNYETIPCDVCELPFEAESFDKLSCRLGFMFFPDMQLAANEMYRVLKPSGKMVTSVWAGPDKNIWITSIMGTINRNLQLEPPPPGAPGMFRCAAPGAIKAIMENAGFLDVEEQLIEGKTVYEDLNHFWEMMNEVAAPVVGALSKADDASRQKIKEELGRIFEGYTTGNGIELHYAAWVISGTK